MNKKSVWAVAAGVIFIVVVTKFVDIALHVAGIFPPIDQPLNDSISMLATSYRIVISVAGAWLTVRLAPDTPMNSMPSMRSNRFIL